MTRVIFRFLDKPSQNKQYDEQHTEQYKGLNLLAHAQIIERSLQSRCGGQNACGTCRVRVVTGTVSAMNSEERALLEKLGGQNVHRLACQCFPEGVDEVIVEVPQERFKDARHTKE